MSDERFTGCYHMARGLARAMFYTFWHVRYHGLERAKLDAPYILIGNHNSMLDPMIVGLPIRRYQVRFLGKKELIKVPLLKWMFNQLRMIPVDRHHSDIGAIRACLKTLKEGHVLGIFPEGTRHKQGVMQEMESGVGMIALRGNAPILPAYITGKPRFLRPIDCYFGEPFSVSDIAEGGVNKEACERAMERIRQVYGALVAQHEAERGQK